MNSKLKLKMFFWNYIIQWWSDLQASHFIIELYNFNFFWKLQIWKFGEPNFQMCNFQKKSWVSAEIDQFQLELFCGEKLNFGGSHFKNSLQLK
jgi:hypothetical protein